MKERPILFSAPMVRAILEGRKTQTRRVVKPQPCSLGDVIPYNRCPYGQPGDRLWQSGAIPSAGYYRVRGLLGEDLGGDDRAVWINPEHFTWGFSENDDPEAIQLDTDITLENIQWKRAGDRLWVRETWQYANWTEDGEPLIRYCADGETRWAENAGDLADVWAALSEPENYAIDNTAADRRWRPSIHMPRWASRIDLEVTGVRVERLQDISEADALAEGVPADNDFPIESGWPCPKCNGKGASAAEYECSECERPTDRFRLLWESINGLGSWDANPWVWVVEFRRFNA